MAEASEEKIPGPLGQAVRGAAEAFVDSLARIETDPYLREGIMKLAIRDAIWLMYHEFTEAQNELAEHIELMGELVQQQLREDVAAKG